jgi:single-stranded-DNA-specific exonuclease
MTPMAEWQLSSSCPEKTANLAREAGIPPILAGLLLRRGVADARQARAFLNPDASGLHDPSLLLGAEAAADLLVSTARRGKRVVVFGDYDVDGVTAVAQLRAALFRVGADAVAFIPHRLRDGYGLRPDTVRRVLAEHSPSTIVTVDCGITAVEGVACARAAGVEVIVTDHHLVPDELPAGAIVVNPRQPGCPYPYKELAASAIAMKIAQAVARRAGVALSLESLLRAACLGTIADLVPLEGENRVIAALGLAALSCCRAPGLRALLAEAGIAPGVAPTSEDVAFRIGPRLNAAGRIDTANLALSLFEERDGAKAAGIASELSSRNSERQSLERRVVVEARARVEGSPDGLRGAVIVEADAGWHRGVLGIAASRLAREYHRPVLLFGLEGDRATGSGRSIPGVSLHGIMKEMADYFLEFGGHEQAAGATLPARRFEAFREEARALFRARIPAAALVRTAEAEAELPIEQVSGALAGELARLEPHGAGNPRPVLLARGVRAAGPFLPVGAAGQRGRLRAPGGDVRCIAWQPDPGLGALASSGEPFDVHYRLSDDRRGYGLQIEIVAARAACGGAA